ncbi:MAG: hypothetical protein J7K13_03165 [Thermoplasmata archaeon]|nr:hypothetical protein [Thermoplasmata archaeon]
MRRSSRTLKATVLTAIIGLSMVFAVLPTASAKSGGLTFNAIVQVVPDTSNLNTPIPPGGGAVSVPITIRYRVDVPGVFSTLPPLIKNYIVYGSMIVPPQKIHLSVIDKPDWADVTISNPDVYPDIVENEYSEIQTTISINVYKDAPARPYTLTIRAESQQLGRVPAASGEAQFKIIPDFIPLITATTDEPTKEVGPLTTVTFPIKITNNGNKESIVRVIDVTVPDGWSSPIPTPTQIVIPQGETGTLTISVTTPAGFGWVPGQVGTVNVKFLIQKSPPTQTTELTEANYYTLALQLRSSGSGLIGLGIGIAAIIVIIIVLFTVLLKKKVGKQQ